MPNRWDDLHIGCRHVQFLGGRHTSFDPLTPVQRGPSPTLTIDGSRWADGVAAPLIPAGHGPLVTTSKIPPSLMTSDIQSPRDDDTPAGDDWRTISEDLLKGLVHALNNRVAALSAFVELAKLGDEEEDPLTVLPLEIAQLHQVNTLFGLLPQRSAEPEPLELRAVFDDALRLHEHHPQFRGEPVDLTFEGAPGAVRAPTPSSGRPPRHVRRPQGL